jgi:electron transport complex protein RnfC
MLAVQIKPEEELLPLISEKRVFVFECLGCREVYYPIENAQKFINSLKAPVVGRVYLNYLCNREFVNEYLKAYAKQIEEAQVILIFSCGVGVQVVSSLLEDRIVYTGCDTLYLNGFQGLIAQNANCDQCGECYLNYSGGMCPITLCAKQLLDGPCGGSQGGKCEVDPDVPCVWQQIVDRLGNWGRLDILDRRAAPKNWGGVLSRGLK